MKRKSVLLLTSASVIALLAGCGGGGGSTTSSAAGAAWNDGLYEDTVPAYKATEVTKTTVTPKNLAGVTTDDVTLSLSVKYQASKSTMRFDADVLGENGSYTGANGKTYYVGDFKPVWEQMQEDLSFTINDVTDLTNNSIGDSFTKKWAADGFVGVDVLNGNSTQINEYGVTNNSFVPLDAYLDYMPDFKQFLASNPIVDTSIRAGDGHIYYAPYFDGYNDLERMFICRQDWVRKLLDDDTVTYDTATTLAKNAYVPYMPESLDTKIAVPSGQITKKYSKNVITRQNEQATQNGASLVKALKDHIDETYGTQYAKRSDLFLSADAAYDADELIALFRVVKTNPVLLTGQSAAEVVPFYPREYKANRTPDLFRLAAIWGVRGMESRAEYLFIDKDGVLTDARARIDTKEALLRMNQMYQEGLICKDFDVKAGSGNWRTDLNGKVEGGTDGLGFMTYDYNQTTVALNASGQEKIGSHFDLAPVMPAVAKWDDGDATTDYFHFTESVRSVKTDGWCINAELLKEGNEAKLAQALELFNYPYSTKGNTLFSYGPDEWLDGTITYMGQQVPKLNEACIAELNNKNIGNGNYTNYYRFFLGGTLPIGYVKQQGMEYQCTHPTGQKGLDNLMTAWNAGTLKHCTPALDQKFYSLVPTTFSFTKDEESLKTASFSELNSDFKQTSSGYIMYADVVKGTMTMADYQDKVTNDNWGLFVALYRAVFERMTAAE